MFCRYCGRKLEDGEVCHCRDNYAHQASGQTPPPGRWQVPPQDKQQVPPPDHTEYYNGSNYGDENYNNDVPKKGHKGLMIGLIIGGAVLVAAVASAAVIIFYNANNKAPKSPVIAAEETEFEDKDTAASKDDDTKAAESDAPVPETKKDSEIVRLKEAYEKGKVDYIKVKQALNDLDTQTISGEEAEMAVELQEDAEEDLTEMIDELAEDKKYAKAFKKLTEIEEELPDDQLVSKLKNKYEVDYILKLENEAQSLVKDKKSGEAVQLLEDAKAYVSDTALLDEIISDIENAPKADDYIIADSNRRYLNRSDVSGLSLREINYAKNEIYARHGRRFASPELQNYFNSKPWYNGTISPDNFDSSVFNDYEKANAEYLKDIEFSIDSRGYQLDAG